MVGRIIETEADVAEGAAWLAAVEPRFAAALALTGPLPLRRRADGFATLFSAIVSQQVSTAAAAAIWGRLEAIGRDGAGGGARRHGRGAARRRAVAAEDRLRPRDRRRPGSTSRRCAALPDAEVVADADPDQGDRRLDRRDLRDVLARAGRRLRAGRPGAAGGGGAAVRAAGAAAASASCGRWPRPGRRGGRWRRGCCGPTTGSGPGGRGCGRISVRVQRLTADVRCTHHARGMHNACTHPVRLRGSLTRATAGAHRPTAHGDQFPVGFAGSGGDPMASACALICASTSAWIWSMVKLAGVWLGG